MKLDRDCAGRKLGQRAGPKVTRLASGGVRDPVAVELQQVMRRCD
jgi:hypothetical protein